MISSNRARKLAKASRLKARKPLRALKKMNPVKFFQGRRFPLKDFRCKVPISQSSENFLLKTAESPFEMKEVLRLRHDVFYKELQDKETENRLDIDELDAVCDHLLIIDKKTHKIVGTYRLISSTFSEVFYSQGEFNLSGVLALPGNKLELGRACIHPDFRSGAIINLLWKGIAEYIKKTDTKFLFGCASVQSTDNELAGRILGYLWNKELCSNLYGVEPTEKYRSEAVPLPVEESTGKEIPALIQSYILAGAKFYGPPALDRDFQCFDFFMMLKVDEMSRLFRRRYRLDL